MIAALQSWEDIPLWDLSICYTVWTLVILTMIYRTYIILRLAMIIVTKLVPSYTATSMCYSTHTPGVGTSIIGHGREVTWWWPPFWAFSIQLGPYFIPHHNPIDPLFLEKKIGWSLSHLVPEILGPKVGLIFHQNVLFDRF